MWRHLLQRLDVAVHPRLRRRVTPNRQFYGIFSASDGGGFAEGEIICLVPFVHCVAANIAAASPWGSMLMDVITSYTAAGGGVRVDYSKPSAITTVFCALLMLFASSPLGAYLQWISLEQESDSDIGHKLGDVRLARLHTIRKLNASIIHAFCEDAAKAGWVIPETLMFDAHAKCSSRCVDVPGSLKVFGGPALVPFVDLINHSEGEPNVAVYLDSLDSVRGVLGQSMALTRDFEEWMDEAQLPFYVVVRAARYITVNEELHYRYLDPKDKLATDSLFWASRFYFCP